MKRRFNFGSGVISGLIGCCNSCDRNAKIVNESFKVYGSQRQGSYWSCCTWVKWEARVILMCRGGGSIIINRGIFSVVR